MIDWAALIRPALPDEHTGTDGSRKPSGNKSGVAGTVDEPQQIDCIKYPEKCSRVPAVPAIFEDVQAGREDDPEPAGGSGADQLRADVSGKAGRRLVIDYGLSDWPGIGGSIIGNSGDTLADLIADLRARYGDRLDGLAVREQFEERAAIMEFDAGMDRDAAEVAAAADTWRTIASKQP